MALRRGFKGQAHQIAREIRAELGVGVADPVDIMRLAEKLEIPLIRLSLLATLEPEAVHHFTHIDAGAFSAATLFKGRARLVVYNDRHAPTRRASDLAHEMSHALLQHQPQAALNNFGCRVWPADYEDEADYLAGALLVSEEAALSIVARRVPVAEAARQFAVSSQMMQYRLNITGAIRRVTRGQGVRGLRSR